MKNNLRKITYIFIICCVLIILIRNVYAVTEEELKSKQNEIEEQINQTNTEIAGIKEDMTMALDQINRLNIQIKEHEDLILEENENLEEIEIELEEKKEQLARVTQNYNKQKELFETRMVAIYESSKTTYLDVLFGAKDISDFISKYYMLQQIAEYDNEILENLEYIENEVGKKNLVLEEKEKEIKTVQKRLDTQSGALEVLVKDKNNLIDSLTIEEKNLEEQLEEFENDKKEIENKLKEIAEQNQIKASITPSNSRIYIATFWKNKIKYYYRVLWILRAYWSGFCNCSSNGRCGCKRWNSGYFR